MPPRKKKSKGIPYADGFTKPNLKKRIAAVGPFPYTKVASSQPDVNDPTLFLPRENDEGSQVYTDLFPELADCKYEYDWLALDSELPEDFDDFAHLVKRKKFPVVEGKTICVVRLNGDYDESWIEMDALKEYAEAFFHGMKVEILEDVVLEGTKIVPAGKKSKASSSVRNIEAIWGWKDLRFKKVKSRVHTSCGKQQFCVDQMLDNLSLMLSSRLVRDNYPEAVCLIAITMEDLFESNPDLFVAGMANGGSKVGIFSFARYIPGQTYSSEFWFDREIPVESPRQMSSSDRVLFLRRCVRILSHEVCHLLGIGHCVFFHCCMNGSGHVEEDDSQPLHLCPVDLRKLTLCVAFPVQERYRLLLNYFQKHDFNQEAKWISNRLAYLVEDLTGE
jgi:predicted Zn-dependent protease